jgi:hypothetical protein
LILLAVEKFLLHSERIDPKTGQPCTFPRWIRLAAPWSYAACYESWRDIKGLADVPIDQLAQIPRENVKVLTQLSTAVRAEPEVLHAAKTMPSEALTEKIRREYPDQHIEARKTFRFTLEESSAGVVEEALREAEIRGARNGNDGLELLAQTALEEWRYEEEIKTVMASLEVNK